MSAADNDVLLNNHTIMFILGKSNAQYQCSFKEYMKEYYTIPEQVKGSIYSIDKNKVSGVVREILNRKLGYYAFRIEQNFGIGNKQDKIAIVNITDQFELLNVMQIQGNDFQISNEDVIGWFKKWDAQFKFRITGVGIDFIEADILTEPTNYQKLATEIYSMCPDVVDQGTDTVEKLAKEMKGNKTMYFWWD